MSVGVNALGIIGSTPKNTLFGFTHFFTDVIQMILVIIKHKEIVGKTIGITGDFHNGK